jgi:hypothetical protein
MASTIIGFGFLLFFFMAGSLLSPEFVLANISVYTGPDQPSHPIFSPALEFLHISRGGGTNQLLVADEQAEFGEQVDRFWHFLTQ